MPDIRRTPLSTSQGWRPRTLIFDDRTGVGCLLDRSSITSAPASTGGHAVASQLRYDSRDIVAVGSSHEAGAISSWATDGSAFTSGRALVTEDLLDHFRGVLEACDTVTGIQVRGGEVRSAGRLPTLLLPLRTGHN